MSVLIKGMDMPENCFDCPCVDAEFEECAAKEHLSLPQDEFGDVSGEIPCWCPLVEIRHSKPDDKLLEESGFEL